MSVLTLMTKYAFLNLSRLSRIQSKELFNYTCRFLTELDISWNGIRPQLAVNLIEVIGENRQLQYLNMSWNNFIEKAEITPQRGGP